MSLPAVGQRFSFRGDDCTIAYISKEQVRFTAEAGGRQRKIPLQSFLEMMESDDFVIDGDDWSDNSTVFSKEEIQARNRLFSLICYIEEQTDAPRSQKQLEPLLDAYGKTHQTTVPSPSHFARLHKRYVEAGCNLDALIPNHRAKGNRKRRLSFEQERMISEVLEEEYFKTNGKTLRGAHQEFRLRMLEADEFQISPNACSRASYATLRRRANNYDIEYRLTSRHGKQKAQRMLSASGIKREEGFPLQNVEADGYHVDCMVVDEETGEVLGRPYLTLFIDRSTRAVLSYHLSLTPFCIDTLLVAFKDALRQDNGLPGGRISHVIVDNGSDFKSNAFRNTALRVGCDLKPCRVRDPNSKPFVESVFKTFNLRCFHTLDGTTFSSPESRGDYDSVGEALYTLDELDLIFETVIHDYHHTVHTQLKRAPILAWQEWTNNMQGLAQVVPLQEINSYLRDVKRYSINRGTVRFEGLAYKSHELRGIEKTMEMRKQKNKEVHIYVDNSDLSHVFVENPLKQDAPLIKAVSTEPERTKGLTMFDYKRQNDAVKEQVKQDKQRLAELGTEQTLLKNSKKRNRIKDNAELRKQRHSENIKKQNAAQKRAMTPDAEPEREKPDASTHKDISGSEDGFGRMEWDADE